MTVTALILSAAHIAYVDGAEDGPLAARPLTYKLNPWTRPRHGGNKALSVPEASYCLPVLTH